MKKILSLALLITACLNTSQATIDPLQEAQVQYLMNQAQFFAQQGISQHEILRIFEENLAHEEFSAAKPQTGKLLLLALLAGAICVGVGSGVTYYLMMNQTPAENHQQGNPDVQQLETQVATLRQQLAQAQNQSQNIDLADLLRQCNEQNNIAGIRQLLTNQQITGDREIARALMRIYMNS
ncbi:hypothetical protein JST56_06360 [Candidatus Dependentiae bacterium]|nr:hypothetical protein [Candidatus Dependentiae bacterium]